MTHANPARDFRHVIRMNIVYAAIAGNSPHWAG